MSLTKSILTRFAHLLSAQAVDGALTTVWFIYLARTDESVFGTIMYALAGGAIVARVVQFGLYYSLVGYLSRVEPEEIPGVLQSVNIIKLLLLAPTMAVVGGLAVYQDLSLEIGGALFFVCLGFGLEVIADTFFADMRVRGQQDQEARIKMISSVVCMAYAFGATALGFSTVVIALFKPISSVIRIGLAGIAHVKTYPGRAWRFTQWAAVWSLFTGASVFAAINILGLFYNRTNVFFLERAEGVEGVALYSAAYNLVDPVSGLASEQLLGWVVFPLLAFLWRESRESIGPVVRTSARWLIVIAFPIMFFLGIESKTILGFVYGFGSKYWAAAWVQQYLVWTIVLSFESNLFIYVMMVSGAQRVLLILVCVGTVLNLVFNIALVPTYGLAGACLVIVLTKLVMTVLTFIYCQWRFHLFKLTDIVYPALVIAASVALFLLIEPFITRITAYVALFLSLEPFITRIPAVVVTLGLYVLVVLKTGPRYIGDLPKAPEGSQGYGGKG